MLRNIIITFFALFMIPCVAFSPPTEKTELRPEGILFLAGGGKTSQEIKDQFVELAGGPEAKIVVIPTASVMKNAAQESKEFWEDSSAQSVVVFEADSQE